MILVLDLLGLIGYTKIYLVIFPDFSFLRSLHMLLLTPLPKLYSPWEVRVCACGYIFFNLVLL